MKYYIDTENVGPGGLVGIGKLCMDDEVILFARGPLSKKITKLATDTNARITVQPVTGSTKNAMDFTIVALAGMTAQPGVIISKDMGYTPAVMLLKSRGIDIMETKSIDDALLLQGHAVKKTPQKKKTSKKKKRKTRNIRSEIGFVLAEEMNSKRERRKAIGKALSGEVDSISISAERKQRIRKILMTR